MSFASLSEAASLRSPSLEVLTMVGLASIYSGSSVDTGVFEDKLHIGDVRRRSCFKDEIANQISSAACFRKSLHGGAIEPFVGFI